jgi:cellulose synthase/poly-beta-1,6-N-acetylglucosamine synthase-like glycosyltransferase
MIEVILFLLGLYYFLTLFVFYLGIEREKRGISQNGDSLANVSILIPARNESETIISTLKGLVVQTYPKDKFEIIVIDDHSIDNTYEVVSQFIQEKNLSNFRVLQHRNDGSKPTYKKAAITFAMSKASGEIIITTDADCRVQPNWVRSMVGKFGLNTGLVAGLVTFEKNTEHNIFHKLQTLEFAGLVFAGVGAVGINHPLICNGSNLAYRRKAFDEVGGFYGHDHLPSGDDDLLVQTLRSKTNWEIRYNLDPNSITFTHPIDSWRDFINQRSRWASKSTHYPGVLTFLFLLSIFMFHLGIFILTPVSILGQFSILIIVMVLLLKIIPDFLILHQALNIFNRKELIKYFLIGEVLHVPYVLISGFRGFFNLFKWK